MITVLLFVFNSFAAPDCEKIKTEALKKIKQANHCKTNDDCILFKSDLTCKGQGINRKADTKPLQDLAKKYSECLAKLTPPPLFACTTDFVTTTTPCQKKKCLNDRDAYSRPD